MTITAASLAVEFGVEGEQQIERSIANVDRKVRESGERGKSMLQSWGSAATKFGGILSLSVTAPLVLLGKGAVTAASDLNEAASAVTTVFGAQSETIKAFADTAAANMGVSEQAALSAASGLGALFKGVGLGEPVMADFSTNLLTAAGDLGSFYNVEPTDVLDNLRSGLVGEAEPLRRFGILLNEETIKAKGLEMGLADAHGELSEGAKVQARYAVIMSQLGSAQGDFARTADGAANSQRILKAEAANLSAELGGVLLPYFQIGIGYARDLVGWFSNLGPAAQRLAVAFGVVAAAAGPGLIIFGQTLGVLSKLGPLLGVLTGPLGLVAAGIAGLALAWANNWFGIRDVTARVVDWLKGTFGRVIEFFQHAKDRGLTPFRLAMRTLIVVLSEKLGEDVPIVRALRGILRNGERFADWWRNDGSTTLASIWESLTGQNGREPGDAGWLIDHLFDDLQGGWDKTIAPWFDDRLADVEAFGGSIVTRIRLGIARGDWAKTGQDLGARLSQAAKDAGAFSEPDWQQLGADLVANTKREIDFLSNVDRWTAEALGVGGFQTSRQSMLEHGQAIGRSLWENTKEELFQISLVGKWVAEQFGASDWGLATQEAIARGSALVGGFMHGAQDWWNNQFAPWFTGLPGQIIGIFANAGGWLKDAGGNLVAGLQAGFDEKWTGFTNNLGTLVGQTPGVANEAVDAKSPAKKMMPVGANMVDGIIAGARARGPALQREIGAIVTGHEAGSYSDRIAQLFAQNLTEVKAWNTIYREFGESLTGSALEQSELMRAWQSSLYGGRETSWRPSHAQGMGGVMAEDGSMVPASFYGGVTANPHATLEQLAERRAHRKEDMGAGRGFGRAAGPGMSEWDDWLFSQHRSVREHIRGMRAEGSINAGARAAFMNQVTPGTRLNPQGQLRGNQQTISAQITINGVQDPKAIGERIANEIAAALGRQQTGMGTA